MPALNPKRAGGFTLIEVLIASAMFLLMMTALYQSLVLAIRLYQKVRDASEIQAETLRVLSRLERSLAGAAASTIQVNPSPLDPVRNRFILFVSAEPDQVYGDVDPTNGKLEWQRIVCFYVAPAPNGRFSLLRKERKLASPLTSVLPSLVPSEAQMVSDPSLPTLNLTSNLVDVSFGDSSSISLKISLRSEFNNGLTIYTRVTTRQ